jgi:hypothetical protein
MVANLLILTPVKVGENEIKRWYDTYSKKLEPPRDEHGPEEVQKLSDDWKLRLGQDAAYFPDYVAFFEKELKKMDGDVGKLFDTYFVELIPGMWTAAFHPLITTGFSLAVGDIFSVKRGLAYMCTTYLEMDPGIDDIKVEDFTPKDVWAVLDEMHKDDTTWTGSLFVRGFQSRLKALRRTESHLNALYNHYGEVLAGLGNIKSSDDLLERLVTVVFELFSKTGHNDFFILHAITSLHAIRFILPMLSKEKDRMRTLKHFLFQLLAAYVVRGRPKVVRSGKISSDVPVAQEADAEATWRDLKETISHYDDVHVIKLAWVAKWNWDNEKEDPERKASFLECLLETVARVDQSGNGWCF